jgi:hypothetical protein
VWRITAFVCSRDLRISLCGNSSTGNKIKYAFFSGVRRTRDRGMELYFQHERITYSFFSGGTGG